MIRQVRNGALAGLAGGLVFGIMMGMMGMLTMIAGMVGSSSAAVGFLLHMVISALIGVGFGVLLHRFTGRPLQSTTAGLLYGGVWWMLGPLTLMPLMMGMGTQWSSGAARAALPSLMGHMIYGAILGFTYYKLERRTESVQQKQYA